MVNKLDRVWHEMSAQEHIDAAQDNVGDHVRASLHMQAAQVQATDNLAWVLENRVLPKLEDALGGIASTFRGRC